MEIKINCRIESEFEKLIVDELDEMKKRKEKEEVQEMAI